MCEEVVSPEHEERSTSLVQEEPEGPPQIKEEPEEIPDDMPRIIDVRSGAPPGKNFNTTDVKTLGLLTLIWYQINNTGERLLLLYINSTTTTSS